MRFKAVPRKKWKQFLRDEGLKHIRTEGDHEIWDRPDKPFNRPVVFRTTDRDIPRLHLHTCLDTLGISHKEFLEKISQL